MTFLKRAWAILVVVVWFSSFFGIPVPKDWGSTERWLNVGDSWLQRHVAYPGFFLLFTALLIGTFVAPQLFSILRLMLCRP